MEACPSLLQAGANVDAVMSDKILRIVIVDDEVSARAAESELLKRIQDTELVGEAEDARSALTLAETLHPDVMLLDVAMPGMNGLELSEILSQRFPEIKLIMLTMYGNFEYAVTAFRNGVIDYLLKDAYDAEPLINALEKARRMLDCEAAADQLRAEHAMQQQIDGGDWKGHSGRFVRLYSKKNKAERLREVSELFDGKDGNAYPVSESIWLTDVPICEGAQYTVSAYCVCACEEDLQRFLMQDAEHFYFPALFKLSGIQFAGKPTDADRAEMKRDFNTYLRGENASFPGDYIALCIEKRFAPDQAKRVVAELLGNLGVDTGILNRIRSAEKASDISLALREVLLSVRIMGLKPENSVIEDIKDYTRENPGADLSLNALSERAQWSPSYLSTVFKQETGEGLKHYITRMRLQKATELLCGSNQKIYVIAEQCGFMNLQNFYERFSERYNMSPQKYRSQGRHNEKI